MSEPFTNEPIAVDDLPQLRADSFVAGRSTLRLGPARRPRGCGRRRRWRRCGDRVAQRRHVLADCWLAGIVVAALAAIAIAAFLEARRLAYQVREHDLSLRSGVIRHRVETIPFSRIQHVSVGRGVIERSLGLATLQVSSAGPDIAVPGLSVADAERIKALVAARAGIDDEPPADRGPRTTGRRLHRRPGRSLTVIDLSQPQRQSPLAVVFLGLRAIRSLGVVQLVVLGIVHRSRRRRRAAAARRCGRRSA